MSNGFLRCVNIVKDYHVPGGRRRVLDGISFELPQGEKLGILGRNGAGKSTLIRIIGGVELPTRGRIERTITVSWPLAFGGAFQGSLSGLDNLRFICRVYNLDYVSTREFVDNFAELGSQLGEPVKTYSSGMRARLAFALSIVIEFDCYLIDEVIMVGDKRFLQRCQDELFGKRIDRTLIIVSHDMGFIQEHCTRGALIHDHHYHEYPSVDAAIEAYNSL
ncbi:ABC transporter ATP-binding protein [Gluconobacter morbifer]|uniref:ABC transporter ATP-binding protein n=1 Tax=Gluconobacter morbifer TaxID=479935 RepID=UPI00058F713B|nr:ABC transporter ATP-binding protein [Gluconobacter morbifer]